MFYLPSHTQVNDVMKYMYNELRHGNSEYTGMGLGPWALATTWLDKSLSDSGAISCLPHGRFDPLLANPSPR